MRRHHRTYTDESPVYNAGPAEPALVEIGITQHLSSRLSCLSVIMPSGSCAKVGIGIGSKPSRRAHCSTLMQEFPEKLRIFKWNADYVRERNALLKEEEG